MAGGVERLREVGLDRETKLEGKKVDSTRAGRERLDRRRCQCYWSDGEVAAVVVGGDR